VTGDGVCHIQSLKGAARRGPRRLCRYGPREPQIQVAIRLLFDKGEQRVGYDLDCQGTIPRDMRPKTDLCG